MRSETIPVALALRYTGFDQSVCHPIVDYAGSGTTPVLVPICIAYASVDVFFVLCLVVVVVFFFVIF
jgi:hypothetical protein